MSAGPLVHGMGPELVAPDWAPITDEEVRAVLSYYPALPAGCEAPDDDVAVTWHSPRPMSSAAVVRYGAGSVFVKRHDRRVRTPAQLATEHAFGRHLRAQGLAVPAVLRTAADATSLTLGHWVYELHEAAPGLDLYRDAMSWTPYTSLGHARAAGATLARVHLAAATFRQPARPFGPLISSCEVVTARDPVEHLGHLLARRPGLAHYLDGRQWADDLVRYHLPRIRRAGPLLSKLERQWGHGDWHPSNLTWTSAGPEAKVDAVLDLGLANRTFAVHDLATALERSTVSWLDLATTGQAEADLGAVGAFLDGYQSEKPLRTVEFMALAEVLPVVHVEYALSEVEYFADVVGSEANADLSYDTYLIGHTQWFDEPNGSALLDFVRGKPAHKMAH